MTNLKKYEIDELHRILDAINVLNSYGIEQDETMMLEVKSEMKRRK
jgi:hypothetical protein